MSDSNCLSEQAIKPNQRKAGKEGSKMYEFLEKLFGKTEEGEPKALTFEELKTAIDADKSIKIVNLKDGGYVSQEKFDAKETELKGVKDQLTAANEQIQSFKDQDVEGIKKAVDEWKTKYDADTEDLKKQLEAQEIRHQRDMYFSEVKFASNAAKIGMMAEFDKQQFQFKDGTFIGADNWLEEQKKNDPASFVQEAPPEPEKKEEPEAPAPVPPKFAAATSKGSGPSSEQMQPFNFGFRKVRPVPESNQ